MDRGRFFKAVARIIFTLLLALALCMDMGVPYLPGAGVLGELYYNFIASLTSKAGGLLTPVFLFLLWANWRIDEKKSGRRLLFPLVSAFIALIWLMAESFRVDNSLWTLHATPGQTVKSFIYFTGITYGINQMTWFLFNALDRSGENAGAGVPVRRRTRRSRIADAYRKHPLLFSFGAVFILWLPHLILAYPANLCWDAYEQLSQVLGLQHYGTHHPLACTLIVGGLVRAGSLISDNFGLFFYILVQAAAGAWILAWTLTLMKELDAPVWLRAVTFGCCVLSPYYTAYIGVVLKDVPYSYAVLLFMAELIYLFIHSGDFFRSRKHVLLLAASMIGILVFRNNGKHILYPAVAAVLLYLFFRGRRSAADRKERRRVFCRAAAALLIPVLLAEGSIAALEAALDAWPGNIREALSFPLQQTARYVKEYGDEVTEEEKEILSSVMEYEKLAETYNPWISDPVKNLFYKPTAQQLKDYLTVWAKQFTKHPFVYFKATVNQNYHLLYPYVPNTTMFIFRLDDPVAMEVQENVLGHTQFHDVEPVASLKAPLKAFYTACFYFPVLNVLSHPVFYVTGLIWLSMFSLYRKRFQWLLVSVPLWCSVAVVVLAPLVDPRYVFPVIYSMPVMLAYFLYLGREGKT